VGPNEKLHRSLVSLSPSRGVKVYLSKEAPHEAMTLPLLTSSYHQCWQVSLFSREPPVPFSTLLALPTKRQRQRVFIVFRFIIEYISLRDFGP